MLRKSWLIGLGFLLSLLLISCTPTPPDVFVCTEINPSKGFCVYTIQDKEFYIDDEHPYIDKEGKSWTWWELRPMFMLVPHESWAEIKTFIITMCKKTKCDENVGDWKSKLDKLEHKIILKNN